MFNNSTYKWNLVFKLNELIILQNKLRISFIYKIFRPFKYLFQFIKLRMLCNENKTLLKD